MEQKPKILLLSSTYLPLIGGSELALKNITDRLDDFEFDLITGRFSLEDPAEERVSNVNVYRVGNQVVLSGFILPKILLPIAVFIKARSLMVKNKYKLVHAYQASQAAGGGWLLKLFTPSVKFMVTLQEGKDLAKQDFITKFSRKLILKKADSITAISNYLGTYARSIQNDLPVHIIPNGVDIEKFSKQFSYGDMANLDGRLGLKPDDKVIITASRLVEKNGVDLLIRAVALLNGGSTNSYKLVLAGDGPQREEMQKLADSLGMSENVVFAGTVANSELPLYLKVSDVFVRPSRSEGLGSAFLEAMAAGLPVIGTGVGGIPDFLEDRKTGLFCSFEPDDIAFKIRIILENEKLRQEIIRNASELVREKYSWDKVAGRFRQLYMSF